MTQQKQPPGQGQSGTSGPSAPSGGTREHKPSQGSSTGARQQPGGPSQDGEETPEEWLEENSLGDPDETGNTITGENEY